MERPFWTAGPIPPAFLTGLALPRPAALADVGKALAAGGHAAIRSTGAGATTLVHQTAATLRQPVLVVDLAALPAATAEEALRRVVQDRPGAGRRPSDWAGAIDGWAPGALLAFDGYIPRLHPWVLGLAAELGRPWLSTGPAGAIVPDAIDEGVQASFLERRIRPMGVGWTPSALREASALAAGDAAQLQRLGSGALRSALEQGRRRIALDDVLEAALEPPGLLPRGDPGPQGARRGLLLAMARDSDGTPTSWAQRAGLEPKAAVVHLRRLQEEGLVQRPARGAYRIASPVLRLRLQARAAAPVRLIPA